MERVYYQPFYLLLIKFVEEHEVELLVEAEVVTDSHVELLLCLPLGEPSIAFDEFLVDLADR